MEKKKPTDWIMYEYRVDTPKSEQFQQYWTICKISRTGRSSIHGEETPATTTHDQVEDKGQQSYYHSTIDGTSGAGGAAGSVTSMPEFERSSQETSGNISEQIMFTKFDEFDEIIWSPFLRNEDLVSGTTEGAEPIQF
ncbi:uncharacterized protein LOC122057059 [Macadamia integrifolia]|uniref:uncharacterized protein LOC122057059 n=1 Tax=Macadamia integrifolia TaxID=60698 RepID=UPI001C52C08D|nr:uncharacterized protein LOC122057059 [Macadamia integrifolia]